jgi:transcriptional regulator GlxA family with amidase domain
MTRSPPERTRLTPTVSMQKKPAAPAHRPLDVWFVLPNGNLLLDWAGPAEALRMANDDAPAGRPFFALHYVAPQAQAQPSVGPLLDGLAPMPATLNLPAWVVVVGTAGLGSARAHRREDRAIAAWLAALQPAPPGMPGGPRLVTVCSGALVAAAAGLLRRRRCTTHHLELDTLAKLDTTALVEPDRVFVRDGEVFTSAGVTAGLDLFMHLIADHCGPVVAARVAQRLAMPLRRGPHDPQLSPFLAHRQHLNARVHRVQDAVAAQPTEDWTAQRMAELAHTTARTLNRLFAEHVGQPPLTHVRSIRLAVARAALASGQTVALAAATAGFSSDLQLRRAWKADGATGLPSGRKPPRSQRPHRET